MKRDWLSEHTSHFGALDREDLRQLPEPAPLIENVLDRRTLALLVAPFGTCKTFTALDWALCVQTGKPWQERIVHSQDRPILPPQRLIRDRHYELVNGEREVFDYDLQTGTSFAYWEPDDDVTCWENDVCYVAAEAAYGLQLRVSSWETAWRTKAAPGFVTVPRAVQLLDENEVRRFVEFVQLERFDLVVFDTLARCMVGGDENSAQDMGVAVANLDRIQRATRSGTVLVLHHTGKDGKTTRGSTALEGAADTVYKIEGDPQYLRLHRTKRKDGPQQDEHQLRLKQVAGTSSCILEPSNPTSGHLLGISPSTEAAYTACLAVADGGPLTRAQLREVIEEQVKLSRAGAYNAISALVRDGLLRKVGDGKRELFIAASNPKEHTRV